jgi:chaperonin GroES
MAINIQPLGDRVVLKQLDNTEDKIGSIYVPDTAKEKPQQGEILAVGDDEDLVKLLKVGDKVIYGKYAGTEIKYAGEKLMILERADVLAKLLD